MSRAPRLAVALLALLHASGPALAQSSSTESALRTVIPQLQRGEPDYNNMEAMLRAAVKQQLPTITPRLKALGKIQSVAHEGVQNGADVYGVVFEGGATVWMIALSPNGKISTLYFQ